MRETSVSELGEFLSAGATSDVFQYGNDSVVKVPRPGVPDDWAAHEALVTEAARRAGARAPEVRDLIKIEGRAAIVFERVDGPSMWDQMIADPQSVDNLVELLANVQRSIQAIGPPNDIPDLVDRTCTKITEVHQLDGDARSEACSVMRSLPRGAALLHGDLHPGNVLMSSDGPMVIDWFDACVGHPVADVIRSSLLVRELSGGIEVRHLPDATPSLLRNVLDCYFNAFDDLLLACSDNLSDWEAVLAASRLTEGDHRAEADLIALWELRKTGAASPVLADRSAGRAR